MAVGFKAVNDTGTVQIDATYKNHVLASKGTLVTTGATVDFTFTGTRPIVAFRCETASIWVQGSSYSGSSYTYRIRTSASATVEWYVFDVPTSTPAMTGFGMVVMNTSGQSTFHSASKPLRIPSIYQRNLKTGGGTTYTGSASGKYGVVFGQVGWWSQMGGSGFSTSYLLTYIASAMTPVGSAQILDMVYGVSGPYGSPQPTYNYSDTSALIVDLTGY